MAAAFGALATLAACSSAPSAGPLAVASATIPAPPAALAAPDMVPTSSASAAFAAVDLTTQIGKPETGLYVDISADGAISVNQQPVADAALLDLARRAKLRDPDARAVIRADTRTTHGVVIHVLDLLKQAGITKMAFAVDPIQR